MSKSVYLYIPGEATNDGNAYAGFTDAETAAAIQEANPGLGIQVLADGGS